MPRKSTGEYPPNWDAISLHVKAVARGQCIASDRDVSHSDVLTVHHVDMNRSNNEWWNLMALCTNHHLQTQNLIDVNEAWRYERIEWARPYIAGMYAAAMGMPSDRAYVESHLAEIFRAWRDVQIVREMENR